MHKEMFNWLLELKLKITIVEINTIWGGKDLWFLFHMYSNKQVIQRWVLFYILMHVLTHTEKGENGKQANDSFLL